MGVGTAEVGAVDQSVHPDHFHHATAQAGGMNVEVEVEILK